MENMLPYGLGNFFWSETFCSKALPSTTNIRSLMDKSVKAKLPNNFRKHNIENNPKIYIFPVQKYTG